MTLDHLLDLFVPLLQFDPSEVGGVVRVVVESTVEHDQAILEEHHKKLFLEWIGCLVEAQEVGAAGGPILGSGENPVLIKPLDKTNGIGHELVGFLDDTVDFLHLF